MAPLVIEQHCNVFSNDNFTFPLKYELDAMEVSTEPAQPSRKVGFVEEPSILNPDTEYYSDEDIAIRWFSPMELIQIKKSAKDFSTLLRRSKRSEETCLTMAHRKTTLMLKSDFKALVKLSPTTPDKDLHSWCTNNDGRRGLERFSSRDYCCFRRKDVIATRTAVFEEQARQCAKGLRDDEIIAKAARETSRRARSFALFFGEADSLEARGETANTKKLPHDPPERRAPPRKRSRISIEIRPAAA